MNSFQIDNNVGAQVAYNALKRTNDEVYVAQLRLSTRKKINSVSDDTSGFATGKDLLQKVDLMKAAQNNVGSAKDMLSTSETQLTSVKDLISKIKTKIVDASNPANDKTRIANDIKALGEEIANIFNNTKFNDTNLLVSSTSNAGSAFSFQTGADSTDTLSINFASANFYGTQSVTIGSATLNGINATTANALDDIQDLDAANATSTTIKAISTNLDTFETAVSNSLSSIGNFQQRLDIKDTFLTASITNSTSSYARLFDADMAQEQLNNSKGQIGQQIGAAMLSQLSTAAAKVLQLFG